MFATLRPEVTSDAEGQAGDLDSRKTRRFERTTSLTTRFAGPSRLIPFSYCASPIANHQALGGWNAQSRPSRGDILETATDAEKKVNG